MELVLRPAFRVMTILVAEHAGTRSIAGKSSARTRRAKILAAFLEK